MKKNLWEVSWFFPLGSVDFETTSMLEAATATDAVVKFIRLLETHYNFDAEKQTFRAEKNHTYFVFIYENGSLRRV